MRALLRAVDFWIRKPRCPICQVRQPHTIFEAHVHAHITPRRNRP